MFSSEGIEIAHTPYQAPKANAFAERWVRSVREECLDLILILNESHLRRVLKEYGEYYNHARPHQGIDQHFPVSGPERTTRRSIRRRDILGESSTIITGSLKLRFLVPDRIISPYRVAHAHTHIFPDFFLNIGITDSNRELEIIILRQQVRLLQGKMKSPWRISDPDCPAAWLRVANN